jgi:hypothetical protein
MALNQKYWVSESLNLVSVWTFKALAFLTCKKTWYLSESKTIDDHCRGAKMSSHLSDMLFWEARAKNGK